MLDETNRNTALASAFVDELARCGVKHAVVSPGSRSSPLTLAIDRDERIETHVVLDERSAGFVALGISLSTGMPALVTCTSGSAVANLHPAVVEADQAGVAMIVASCDRPPELRGIGAGQTIDQIDIFGSSARWFCEVGTHEADDAGVLHLRSTGCRAYAEAAGGRGPVHINLSWRDPLGPEQRPGEVTATDALAREGRSESRPLTTSIRTREPHAELIDALAGSIEAHERPMLVAGRLPDRTLVQSLTSLAAAIGAPILAEPTSQLRFGSHDRSRVVTTYDALFRDLPERLAPDLIIRFGDMPTSKPLRTWLATWNGDQIVVDPPSPSNEPTRKAGAMIDADATSLAKALTGECAGASVDSRWSVAWRDADRAARNAVDELLAAEESLSEPSIHVALGQAFGDGERVLIASSMPIRDAEAFMDGSDADVTIHSNRGANGIDGLLSTAAGIASGSGSPTWLVIGDLALAHDAGGLAAVADAKAPVRIVVLDNAGGRIFDFLPQANQIDGARFERLFTTPSPLRDPAALAEAYCISFVEIDGLRDLTPLTKPETTLARVQIGRDDNVFLHQRLAQAAVRAALDPTL